MASSGILLPSSRGEEQAANKAPAGSGGVGAAAAAWTEFEGQACLLAVRAPTVAATSCFAVRPAATGRPGTQGQALGCQIRRQAAPEIKGC